MPFLYCTPWQVLFNDISSDRNENCMQKLHPCKLGIPTYHFGVHKTIGVSYSSIKFRVHHSLSYGVIPCHYCTPWQGLSNNLLSNPNRNHVETLCPQRFDVANYYFRFTKLFVFHLLRSCLCYTIY